MNIRTSLRCFSLGLALASFSRVAFSQEALPPQTPQFDDQIDDRSIENDDMSVLLRGPLHEAYAEQFSVDPEPGVIVPSEPPPMIQELTPEYRPEIEDVTWIPGYWGWDPETDDYIWISGIWRQAPPNQQWIPGYWIDVDGGWQWIGGFWNSVESQQIAYLPAPPPSLENGPSSPAPEGEHFWIPGNWSYEGQDYLWQAGYWSPGHQNWIWIPARYVWTPSGCIFRAGYWDLVVQERGMVFCPVRFNNPVINYQFTPTYIVETSPSWYANLFVCPRYNHYMYGNYFGYSGRYAFHPWATYYQSTRRYDPLYSYYAYRGRNNSLLSQFVRLHNYYRLNQAFRPAVTLYGGRQQFASFTAQQQAYALRTANIASLTRNNASVQLPFQTRRIDQQTRQRFNQTSPPVQQFVDQRRSLERAGNDQDRLRARVQTDESLAGSRSTAALNAGMKRLQLNNSVNTDARRIASGLTRAEVSNEQTRDGRENSGRGDRNSDTTRTASDLVRDASRQGRNDLQVRDPNGNSQSNDLGDIRTGRDLRERITPEEIARRRAAIRRSGDDSIAQTGNIGGNNRGAAGASADRDASYADSTPPSVTDIEELRRSMIQRARSSSASSANNAAANQNASVGRQGQAADLRGSRQSNSTSGSNPRPNATQLDPRRGPNATTSTTPRNSSSATDRLNQRLNSSGLQQPNLQSNGQNNGVPRSQQQNSLRVPQGGIDQLQNRATELQNRARGTPQIPSSNGARPSALDRSRGPLNQPSVDQLRSRLPQATPGGANTRSTQSTLRPSAIGNGNAGGNSSGVTPRPSGLNNSSIQNRLNSATGQNNLGQFRQSQGGRGATQGTSNGNANEGRQRARGNFGR